MVLMMNVHDAAADMMRHLPVRRVSIECTANPEWGTWGVMEDRGLYYEIGNGRGARVLSKDEAAQYWRLAAAR